MLAQTGNRTGHKNSYPPKNQWLHDDDTPQTGFPQNQSTQLNRKANFRESLYSRTYSFGSCYRATTFRGSLYSRTWGAVTERPSSGRGSLYSRTWGAVQSWPSTKGSGWSVPTWRSSASLGTWGGSLARWTFQIGLFGRSRTTRFCWYRAPTSWSGCYSSFATCIPIWLYPAEGPEENGKADPFDRAHRRWCNNACGSTTLQERKTKWNG